MSSVFFRSMLQARMCRSTSEKAAGRVRCCAGRDASWSRARALQRGGTCFSIAAGTWHCYSTPPTNIAHQTLDRYATG